MSLKLVFIKRS